MPSSREPGPDPMGERGLPHGKSFEENLAILFDELLLAGKWGRPSLLLAVHKSSFGQAKAEHALEERLEQQGLRVERIVFNDSRSDIAELLRAAPSSPKTVFFISNVDWGGGSDGRQAYRGLNMHRELFVERAIKAVFWLTVQEAANIPRFAPDFWAFRHRVVEFVSQRSPGKVQLPAGILAWEMSRSPDPFESPRGGIQAREELLRTLPESLEALSTRVDLHGGIGHLHWILGELEPSLKSFERGLALAADHALPEAKAGLLNGIGIVLFESGSHAGALERFNEGLHYRSSSRALLINLSATQCVLGRIQAALALGHKAIRSNPTDADTWFRLGYIYHAAGRTDEAIAGMAKAAELGPRVAAYQLALAVLYSLVERPEDSGVHLARARQLTGESGQTYTDVLESALQGHQDAALARLRKAVAAGSVTAADVSRDLNLNLLFDAAQLGRPLSGA